MSYPHSYQSIPLLSETPGNNSVLLKHATTHATADQGTAHELRPRLFPHFVVNSLPLRSNPAPFRVTPLLLHTSLTIWQEAEEMWKKNNRNFQWIKPNVKILRGLGAIKLREKEKLAPEWLNERYIEIVTETTWLIWNIRNKRIFDKIKLTKEEATKKSRETMNNKLETEKTIIKIEDKIKKKTEMQKNFDKKWKKTKPTNKETT